MSPKKIYRIAVVTSGGDCPGLNACIRAVVRRAIGLGIGVWGIRRGFKGLMEGELIPLNHQSTSGLIHQGGTFLLSARSEEFYQRGGRETALQTLEKNDIDGLIVMGGNGSLRGAWELSKQTPIPIVGIPKSIDNDVGGTDYSIGFDTAVNTVVSAIDRLRDTATSHERLFLVEVMGRDRGFLALASAISSGAEEVLLPETPTNIRQICTRLKEGKRRGKLSSIIVVAEGDEAGGALKIAQKIKRLTDYDIRVSVLGHLQRGGRPSAFDRFLASQLGCVAVEVLCRQKRTCMVGLIKGKVKISPLTTAWKAKRRLDPYHLKLSRLLV